MYWSQADAATHAQWLDAGFAIARQNFVPEGDAGHELFVAIHPRANPARAARAAPRRLSS